MKYCYLRVLVLFSIFSLYAQNTADIIIFSYDRPMQLEALLHSIDHYVSGLHNHLVLYRTSNEQYEQAYQIVQQEYPHVLFIKQKSPNGRDFKPLLLECLNRCSSNYVMCAVDDMVVKDYVDCAHCIELLEHTHAYGIYLRLGTHLSYCYPVQQQQPLPPLLAIAPGIYRWQFNQGTFDWAYPHTVDMTLYRKSHLQFFCVLLSYYSPNTFEGNWAACAPRRAYGLCYEQSKVVNIPLNKVQQDNNNIHMNAYTPAQLLHLFEQGMRFDIHAVAGVKNPSAHTAYYLPLITKTARVM